MAHQVWHLSSTMALVATLIAPAVFAQSQRAESRMDEGWLGSQMMSAIELSDEQQAELELLRAEMHEDVEPLREEVQALKQELAQAWSAEIPDRELILNLDEWLLVMETIEREREYDFRYDVLELLEEWQREMIVDNPLSHRKNRARERSESGLRYGRLVNQLELDELQQGHVFDLMEDLKYQTAPASELLEELEKEIALLWSEDDPDEETIYQIDADMDALRWMIREREVDFRLALVELLDGEQRVQLAALLERTGRRGPRAETQRSDL